MCPILILGQYYLFLIKFLTFHYQNANPLVLLVHWQPSLKLTSDSLRRKMSDENMKKHGAAPMADRLDNLEARVKAKSEPKTRTDHVAHHQHQLPLGRLPLGPHHRRDLIHSRPELRPRIRRRMRTDRVVYHLHQLLRMRTG